MKQYTISIYYLLALLVLFTGACSKIDDYKSKYMQGGAITYSGKMDSVKIFSGRYRVKITGLFTSDPNIVKYRVFWNSGRDSVEVAVARTAGVDTAKVMIPNLPEGLMSFRIRTYDAQGHSSVPVDTAANIYGDLYQSSLVNRAMTDAALQSDASALITWADINKDAGIKNMEIKYADSNNILHDTLIMSVTTGQTTKLPIFKAGNTFSYSTAYLPNPTALDTFYVPFQAHGVKYDVTKLYLTNTGPFTRATYDGGRWGTLAAPWTTSAGVINHSGYGGYAADAGGSLVMESGWSGTANIINGKIYQTVTLPAGNYIFQVTDYTEALDPVYVVAAAGTGLPDISNISGALGYTRFTTTVKTTETIQFPFTVAQQQAVSLGFLATMTSGNQYWRVTSVKLIKN
jgi:hypothetical protein